MCDGADAFPSPSNLYLCIAALALNGRGEEAQARMKKMGKTMAPGAFEEMGRGWARHSSANKSMMRIEWPKMDDAPSQPGASGKN